MRHIAHRGSLASAPENTLTAFTKALHANVDMIELDVRVCKTGEPIIMHDATVDRTTNGKGKVKNLSLTELQALRIDKKERIPTLQEAIDLLGGKTVINIEIKTRGSVKTIVDLVRHNIQRKKLSYDDFVIASANILTLREVYKRDKKFRLSLILRYFPSLVIRVSNRYNLFSVQPVGKVTTEKLVNSLQEKDIQVFPWVVKTTEDGTKFFRKMKKLGVDGIISFFPEKLKEHEKKS
ncbi:MAG TPA: glycerophosphodiester phosphodiesterase family protein [Patescibacteria group bacterium]|nr:glycerophosphodiester phosphodiesterase family protein [Patescibacteria group bacterium]